jgi:hypothetical protein
MGNILRGLLGISAASLIRGLFFGLAEFRSASAATTKLIFPFESARLRSFPVRSLDDILLGHRPPIRVGVEKREVGSLRSDEMVALISLAVTTHPATVLEIGTFMGYTSKALALNLPKSLIHTLDLPLDFNPETGSTRGKPKDDLFLIKGRSLGREFIHTPQASQIRQHLGDSATWNFQDAEGADFFFIDGSHTYDYCKQDSNSCFDLCGGEGTFIWHDCDDDHPGVIKALLEWRAAGRDVVRISGTHFAYWNSRS